MTVSRRFALHLSVIASQQISVMKQPGTMHAGVSAAQEDKPEQEVSRLGVTAAAPIKHEHHMEGIAQQLPPVTAPHFVPVKQEQPTGTTEQQDAQMTDADARMTDADAHMTYANTHVASADMHMTDANLRMTAAGAEVDPLQHGHPAQLQTPFEPLSDPPSDPAVSLRGSPSIDIMNMPQNGQPPLLAPQQADQVAFDPISFLTDPSSVAVPAQQSARQQDRPHPSAQQSSDIHHDPLSAASWKEEPGLVNGMTGFRSEGVVSMTEASGNMVRGAVKAEPSSQQNASNGNKTGHGQQHMKAEPMDVDAASDAVPPVSQTAQPGNLGEQSLLVSLLIFCKSVMSLSSTVNLLGLH